VCGPETDQLYLLGSPEKVPPKDGGNLIFRNVVSNDRQDDGQYSELR
jgi:hypothetical protein